MSGVSTSPRLLHVVLIYGVVRNDNVRIPTRLVVAYLVILHRVRRKGSPTERPTHEAPRIIPIAVMSLDGMKAPSPPWAGPGGAYGVQLRIQSTRYNYKSRLWSTRLSALSPHMVPLLRRAHQSFGPGGCEARLVDMRRRRMCLMCVCEREGEQW